MVAVFKHPLQMQKFPLPISTPFSTSCPGLADKRPCRLRKALESRTLSALTLQSCLAANPCASLCACVLRETEPGKCAVEREEYRRLKQPGWLKSVSALPCEQSFCRVKFCGAIVLFVPFRTDRFADADAFFDPLAKLQKYPHEHPHCSSFSSMQLTRTVLGGEGVSVCLLSHPAYAVVRKS